MIELVLGLLIAAAGCIGALGLAQPLVSFPIPLVMASGLCALGGVIAAHGLFRTVLRRASTDRHWLLLRGLTGAALAALAAILTIAVLGAPFFNAVRISGFPLGYYLAAQGALIALVALAFAAASRAEAIDASAETDRRQDRPRHDR